MGADRKADQDLLTRMKEEIKCSYNEMKANQEELLARMDDYHEKRMAMLDAHQKRMIACLGQMEANTKKTEQDPGMMPSMKEHQDTPTEEVAVMPVKGLRKQHRGRKLTAG
jgi:hypothetical protein